MQYLFIVETESGSCDHGDAMIFDSVWSTKAQAVKYCERFHSRNEMGGFGCGVDFDITKVTINKGS